MQVRSKSFSVFSLSFILLFLPEKCSPCISWRYIGLLSLSVSVGSSNQIQPSVSVMLGEVKCREVCVVMIITESSGPSPG